MNQGKVKVAPTSSGDGTKPAARRLPSSRNLFSAAPAQVSVNVHEESAERRYLRIDDELRSKKATYIFMLALGLVLIAGGSAMTWWGTQSEVKDLLIIGPGSIIIGFGLTVIGIVFGCRTMYFRRKVNRIKNGQRDENPDADLTHLQKEYFIPEISGDKGLQKRPPSGDALYGENDATRARKTSLMTQQMTSPKTTGVVTPPVPVSMDAQPSSVDPTTDISAPIVSFTRSMADQEDTGPTYQVTMNSPVHKPGIQTAHLPTINDDDENDTNHDNSVEDNDEVMMKTRPDSGYVPDTPDTLDTVLGD